MVKLVVIIDRCDGFYEVVDADSGEVVALMMNGRFASHRSAKEAALNAGFGVMV